MALRNEQARWGAVSQLLHWLIVALVAAQVSLALVAKHFHHGPKFVAILGMHKSLGITILALVVVRLLWRWSNPVPELPGTLKPHERALARTTHVALYVILFALPLTGWAGSSAHGIAVRWFDLFTLPNLVGKNPALSGVLGGVHWLLAVLLGLVVVLHIAAALRHHYVLKDDTLRRMLPFGRSTVSGETGGDRARRASGV